MILVPNYWWERVQKHRITLGIQYHDIGTSIGTYIVGNTKKTLKKDQNPTNPALFGGVYWNSSLPERPPSKTFGTFEGGYLHLQTLLCDSLDSISPK